MIIAYLFFDLAIYNGGTLQKDLYGLLICPTLKPHEVWKKQEEATKFKTDDKSERIERLFAPNLRAMSVKIATRYTKRII